MKKSTAQSLYSVLSFLVFTSLMIACGSGSGSSGAGQSNPVVQVIPSGKPPEKQELAIRETVLPNCGGSEELSYDIGQTQTINYTLDMGTDISVNASGTAEIPGVGEVQVGAEVSRNYSVSYGNNITSSRSGSLKAAAGSLVTYTYRIIEYWETGNIKISNGPNVANYPYRFRHDFDIVFLSSTKGICPSSNEAATTVPTPNFLQALSGTYHLVSWNESVSTTTIAVTVPDGTLTINAGGAADWLLTIQPSGQTLQPTPQIKCGGQVRLSSQQIEGVPGGARNGTKDVAGNAWPDIDLLFLTFCGWSLQQGAEPFSLHLDTDGAGKRILEMRNSKGIFTWRK